ncbi:(S)-benzoin forming benzil reductase [Paenibacillus sp. HWE-109]|uniref:(S)-benzoin forming benzil reductase n=1 Tax=Paenibacillus sp. HWE-109 TaxID=1306526 RepID=UPI001EDFBB05|nr:(S)-benzoin forming benzil reductase [Paenibacillus sp. HWE-109]UKS28714.1 (S)-benzoin forming benzil reductase [Paenibacillus sp. HWE-109]
MKYFLLTGTSRGLGEALAEQLIHPEHHLICLSRTMNKALISKDPQMDYLEIDLNEVDQIALVMEQAFSRIDRTNAEGIYLINNAAVVTPLSRIEQGNTEQFKQNLTVNLLAPIVMTSTFIRLSEPYHAEKRVLNISSSSAKNLLPGMSVYSASKAGLDVFSKGVGAEQGEGADAVKVVSVWPGMIDTALQTEARNMDKETFASADIFQMVKDRGMLASPADVATKLIKLLLGDHFIQGTVVEI